MDRATKKKLIKDCKVNEPIPKGDRRHFNFDKPELELRGRLWRHRVADVISLANESTTQIVTGLSGSGKSTELKLLQSDLQEEGFQVVLADAASWIRDDQPITTRDILLALILALYPSGRPDSGVGWLTEYAKQVWEFLQSETKITQLGLKGGITEVKAELTTNDTLFQQVARQLGELQSFREQVFDLLNTAARAADRAGSPLVLILDGIEKRATGDLSGSEERERFRMHWFGAFLTNARDLQPPVHVVYTVPPFMIRRASELSAGFGTEVQFLPMVRMFQRELAADGRPQLHEPGARAMRDALFLRVPKEHFEHPAVAAWLAVHSGGYMRDLLRLVIDCIFQVPAGQRITRDLADQAIIQLRQSYREGLELQYESLLRQVHENREFPMDASNREYMDSLLQGYLMLRYHNHTSWYDAHPLLWRRLEIEGPTWDEIVTFDL
ncbi:MAG: hypothetical protein AAF560_05095 [Acidobacteriota bacterium]